MFIQGLSKLTSADSWNTIPLPVFLQNAQFSTWWRSSILLVLWAMHRNQETLPSISQRLSLTLQITCEEVLISWRSYYHNRQVCHEGHVSVYSMICDWSPIMLLLQCRKQVLWSHDTEMCGLVWMALEHGCSRTCGPISLFFNWWSPVTSVRICQHRK
jgi:hypothetical protein